MLALLPVGPDGMSCFLVTSGTKKREDKVFGAILMRGREHYLSIGSRTAEGRNVTIE